MPEYVSLGGNCAIAYNLKKYKKESRRFPFDWCDMSVNKLNNVLENNFKSFSKIKIKKLSKNHSLIIDNIKTNLIKSDQPSLILSNEFNIKFAHELANKYQLADFSQILEDRIKRFYELDKPTFIRIETQSKSIEYFQKEYGKLLNNLKKIYGNFKLILIINIKYCKIQFPDYVTVFYFSIYSSDWRYPNLDWDTIFNE